MSTTYFYNRDTAITFDEGSAASPSLSFAGDTDTGLYSGGTANTVRIAVGGSQKTRFDANGLSVYTGNLYIESGYKLNFDLNVSNNYYLQKSSTTLYMHSPVNLSLQTNSNHRLYINQTGQVGIGTTTPGQKLDVRNGTLTVRDDSNTNYVEIDRFAGITLKGNGTAHKTIQTPNTDALAFGTNNTERMRIDSGGRVFIGTTTYGANNNGNDLVVGNTSGTHGLTIVSQNNSVGIIYFGDNDNNDAGNINYEHGNNQLRFVTNRTQKMVIDSSGRVGIGTTSPLSWTGLHVTGHIYSPSAFTSDAYLRVRGVGQADKVLISGTNDSYFNGGNVGIGTETPDAKLTVQSDTADSTVFAVDGVNGRLFSVDDSLSDSLFSVNTIAGLPVIEAFADNTVVMGAYNQNDLVISDNKIGIGTDAPDEILHIHNPAAGGLASFAAFTNETSGLTQEFLVGINEYEEALLWNENNKSIVFATNNGERMRILNNGNVGIGTTSPSRELEVTGAGNVYTRVTSAAGSDSSLELVETGGQIYSLTNEGSTNSFKIKNGGGTRLTISESGNVGIGTTSPGYKLEVIGTTRIDGALTIADTSTAASYIYLLSSTSGESEIRMGDTDTDAGSIAYNNANNYMAFRANAAERLRIRSNGNIGINTTSPSAKLHVVGDNVGSTSGDEALLSIIRGARHSLEFKHIRTADATDWNSTTYRLQNKVDTSNMQSIDFTTDSGFNRHVDINTASNAFNTRFTHNGRVGIGTTNPLQKLQVAGSIYANGGDLYVDGNRGLYAVGNLIFKGHNGSNYFEGMRLTSTGNVGINTTNPSYKLQVAGTGFFTDARFGLDGGDRIVISRRGDNNVAVESFAAELFLSSGYNGISFEGSANTTLMKLTDGGNLGIGTSSPVGRLEVVTTDANRYVRFKAPNGEERFQFYTGGTGNPATQHMYNADGTTKNVQIAAGGTSFFNGGNVGIGTTSPSSKLSVAGTVFAYGTTNDNAISKGQMLNYAVAKFKPSSLNSGTLAIAQVDSGNSIGMQFTNGAGTADWDIALQPFGGRVGIGTAAPDYMFTVAGSNGNFGVGSTGNDLYFTRNSANYFYATGASSSFRFFTAGVEKLSLGNTNSYFPNGNVGIGTTSPAEKLDVRGNLNLTLGSTSTTKLIPTNNGGNSLLKFKGGNFFHYVTFETSWNDFEYATLKSSYNGSDSEFFLKKSDSAGATVGNTKISTGTSYFNNTLGIATTGPYTGAKLHVSAHDTSPSLNGAVPIDITAIFSNSDVAYGTMFATDSSGKGYIQQRRTNVATYYDLLVQPHGGNVGIGTSSPQQKLHVDGRVMISSSSTSPGIQFQDVGTTNAYIDLVNGSQRFDFKNDATTTMSLALNTGRVGIGNTAPVYKIHAKTSDATWGYRFENNTGVEDVHTFLSHGNGYGIAVDSTSNSSSTYLLKLAGGTGGTGLGSVERFRVTSAGNVGIGQTAPSDKLSVNGSIGVNYGGYLGFYRYPGVGHTFAADGVTSAMFGVSSGVFTGRVNAGLVISGYDQIRHYTNNVERMRIDTSGNVGIGTTSPAAKLNVVGTSIFSGTVRATTASWGNGGRNIISVSSDASDNNSGISFYDNAWQAHIDHAGGDLKFLTGGTNEAMRVYSNGNVGIGTTIPTEKLHVEGRIRIGSTPEIVSHDNITFVIDQNANSGENFLNVKGGSVELFRVNQNGNVGIGTTTPNAKLEVYGSGSTVLDIQGSQGQLFSVTDSLTGSLMSVNDISGLPILEVFDTDKVVMGEFGSNALVVSGSRVGVGTDSPARQFEIHENTTYLTIGEKAGYTPSNYGPILETNSGTMVMPNRTYWSNSNVWIDKNGTSARFHGDGGILFSYYNGGTNEAMRITNSGNVGIGTTSPAYKLDVNGNARVTSTLDVTGNIGTAGNITANGYIGSNTSQTRDKLRVWNSGAYAIGMKSGFTFGPLQNNYAMSFQMNNQNERGFWWGDEGHSDAQGAMALSTRGFLTVAEKIRVGYGQSDTADTPVQALDVSGNAVISNAVSIGTTAIAAKLTIEGDGSLNSNIKFKQAGSQEHFLYATTNTQNNLIGSSTPKWVWGQQNGADRMVLDNNALLPGTNPGFFIGREDRRWEIVFCNILDSAGLHEKNLENPEGEKSVGEYATGTVLVWKGGKNVPCTVEADHMRMGIAVEEMNSPLVQGAEPVLVTGIANEGDYLITSEKEGHARAISREEMLERNLYDCVLGKVLESGSGESYLLRVWITI